MSAIPSPQSSPTSGPPAGSPRSLRQRALSGRSAALRILLALLIVVAVSSTGEAQPRRGRVAVLVSRPVFAGSIWYGYPPYLYPYPGFYPGYGYPFYGPYPYYGRFDPGSAVRVRSQVKEAEVYVDGYYAGIVDDFDGVFQRLRLPPGEHELALYLDGYRTYRQMVLLRPDSTFTLEHTMEPLDPGDPPAVRPSPSAVPAPPGPAGSRTAPPPQTNRRRPAPRRPDRRTSAYGTLSLRVQPADAVVLIDGERWDGADGQGRLLVELPEGPHRVEIRAGNGEPYVTTVTIRAGETVPLNVSLTR